MKRLCASVLTSAIVLSSQMSWAADTDLAALEQAAKRRRSQQRRHAGQLGQLERHLARSVEQIWPEACRYRHELRTGDRQI